MSRSTIFQALCNRTKKPRRKYNRTKNNHSSWTGLASKTSPGVYSASARKREKKSCKFQTTLRRKSARKTFLASSLKRIRLLSHTWISWTRSTQWSMMRKWRRPRLKRKCRRLVSRSMRRTVRSSKQSSWMRL